MLIEIITVTVLLLCALVPRDKVVYILQIILMGIFMVFATQNADMNAYERRYEGIETFSGGYNMDMGFGVLMYVCKTLGFSYRMFLFVVFMIAAVLMTYAFFKYTENPCLHLAVYFFMFYLTHTIQLRAFIAEWIVTVATIYLLRDDAKIHFFVVMVLIASTIHFAVIFSLCLLIPRLSKDAKKTYASILIIAIISPFVYGTFSRIIPTSARNRLDVYTRDSQISLTRGAIIFLILLVGLTIIMHYVANRAELSDRRESKVLRRIYQFDITNIIPFFLIVFYSNNFFRLTRPMIIVSMVFLIEYLVNKLREDYGFAGYGWIVFGLTTAFIMREFASHAWYEQILTNTVFKLLT